jgi:hypothetical protein
VTHEDILEGQRQSTLLRAANYSRVLMVEDTATYNFSSHPATTGLGTLENKGCRGFLAHTTLVVSTDGVPLGVLEQLVWVRPDEEAGISEKRHERRFAEKESYKWVDGLPDPETLAVLPSPVVVCDAESHIYEFLNVLFERGIDFVVRAADARSFSPEGEALFDILAQSEVNHTYTLSLARRPDRDPREATLQVRFRSVTIRRPKRADCEAETLTVWAIDVFEPNPPEGESAVHWVLLTSIPVENIEQALEIVRWYTYRWLIERLHYVLKSGCKIEERQLREAVRLQRLLAIYNLVAWRLLWMTYQSRLTPDAPCTVALSTEEWQALYMFVKKTRKLPKKVPTLSEAIRWITGLGGFLGRKGDGNPGVKVLWRGWMRLQDIVSAWNIFSSLSKDVGNG